MEKEITIEAQERKLGVRNPARKALRNGQISCVYYTRKENIPLFVDRHDFEKKLPHINTNTLISLNIAGKEKKALIQDHSIFLFNRRLSHIDFLGVQEGEPFKVKIPLDLQGVSVGVTKGGVLRRFINSVRVLCKSVDIVPSISVDISRLDVGDIIYIRDLVKENQDITFLEPPQKPVVSILASRAAQTAVVESKEVPKNKEEAKNEETT